jgi:TRAP-type mannitol/chloroaromatic compound transport system permease small subunit
MGTMLRLVFDHGGAARLSFAIMRLARWLALPIAALLFLQWPFRDWVHVYSREANDLGQVLFALFVAVSVAAASRARVHIAADMMARAYVSATRRRIEIAGIVLGLLPWCLFVAWSAARPIWQSIGYLERFPDTANSGYFILKSALMLLVILALVEAVASLSTPPAERADDPQSRTDEPTA